VSGFSGHLNDLPALFQVTIADSSCCSLRFQSLAHQGGELSGDRTASWPKIGVCNSCGEGQCGLDDCLEDSRQWADDAGCDWLDAPPRLL